MPEDGLLWKRIVRYHRMIKNLMTDCVIKLKFYWIGTITMPGYRTETQMRKMDRIRKHSIWLLKIWQHLSRVSIWPCSRKIRLGNQKVLQSIKRRKNEEYTRRGLQLMFHPSAKWEAALKLHPKPKILAPQKSIKVLRLLIMEKAIR